MAQVYQCDRCGNVASECEPVRGRDLCAACITGLDAWMTAVVETAPKLHRTHRPKTGNDSMLAVFTVLAGARGNVSASELAAATGEPYRQSYLRLRRLFRKGLIERVSGCVYRLPAATESEAAE